MQIALLPISAELLMKLLVPLKVITTQANMLIAPLPTFAELLIKFFH